MCRSFEVISGKKNKGDKGLLKGLTKMYRDAKYSVAKYPFLDYRLAMSLYVEDMIVESLGLEQAREVKENSTKLVMIKKRKNIA